MKILKNKKGFTLIELLAVIVVLAIIMVIATTQINNTIKKSRANSFYDTVQMLRKNANMACAANGEITAAGVLEYSDVSTEDVSVTDDGTGIKVAIVAGGEFAGVDLTKYYHTGDSGNGDKVRDGITNVAADSMTFSINCNDPLDEGE